MYDKKKIYLFLLDIYLYGKKVLLFLIDFEIVYIFYIYKSVYN